MFFDYKVQKNEKEIRKDFIFYKKLQNYTENIKKKPIDNLTPQQKQLNDQKQQELAKKSGNDLVDYIQSIIVGKNTKEIEEDQKTFMSGDDMFFMPFLKKEIEEYRNQAQEYKMKIQEYESLALKLSTELWDPIDVYDQEVESCNDVDPILSIKYNERLNSNASNEPNYQNSSPQNMMNNQSQINSSQIIGDDNHNTSYFSYSTNNTSVANQQLQQQHPSNHHNYTSNHQGGNMQTGGYYDNMMDAQ